MIKKSFFLIFLVVLAGILYLNPNFKTIGAGVSILLFGMIMLEEGFKVFTKGPLQKILKNATNKLYKSISTGALVTAFIQSSSLVSIIAISFISAGLISLYGGIGLIFGANIGTTATAWLVAGFGLNIKISALALPMLVFGIVFSFQKKESYKGIGNVLAGLGFFFLGIHFMKEGFDVFKGHIDLTQYAVSGFLGVFIFTGLGMLITTILQSSSATLALILTALAAGQIEYENALALTIGANIGTTITAVMGSLGSNVSGKRLAGAHLVFNFVTGIVALAVIFPLAKFVNYLSHFFGIGVTNYTLKLALFHSIFNLMGVLLMLPFIKKLERLLVRIFKERLNKGIEEPKYLNKTVLKVPASVISSLFKESQYLYENAIFEIVTHALNIHREDIKSHLNVKHVVKKSKEDFKTDVQNLYTNKVKTIYGEIIRYATIAQSTLHLSESQIKRITEIEIANRKMVEIIKIIADMSKNISKYLNSENEHIKKEYDRLRKKGAKALRDIYLFRTELDNDIYYLKLQKTKVKSREYIHMGTKQIDALIRENLIDAEMASSLVNDNDNVNKIIKRLIEVAELLYGRKDSILENHK